MDRNTKAAVRSKVNKMVSTSNSPAVKSEVLMKIAARKAYRAKIASLLNKSRDERLADVWRRVYPFPIESPHELPDRRGIIEDLADFAVALRPSLSGMPAHRLCQLVEKYAAYESRPSELSGPRLARLPGN